MSNPRLINSPLFGESIILSGREREELDELISESPVDVFQSLNKFLNGKGLMIQIIQDHNIK